PGLYRHPHDQRQHIPHAVLDLGGGRRAAHRAWAGKRKLRDRLPVAAGGPDEARPPAALPRLLLVCAHLPVSAAPKVALGEGRSAGLVRRAGAPMKTAPNRSISCVFLHSGLVSPVAPMLGAHRHSTRRRQWPPTRLPPPPRQPRLKPSPCVSSPRGCR